MKDIAFDCLVVLTIVGGYLLFNHFSGTGWYWLMGWAVSLTMRIMRHLHAIELNTEYLRNETIKETIRRDYEKRL